MAVIKAGLATMTRVQDVMTSPVVKIDAEATVFDAASELSAHHIGGAPVVSGDRIVGMVSKSDLVDPRNELEARVDRVMTRVLYAVRASDPVMLAIKLMVDEKIHRALVVDDRGGLVGIVAPIDVCRALRRGLKIGNDDKVDVEFLDLRKLG